MPFRSAPAKKLALPEARITPRSLSFSASTRSAQAMKSSCQASDMVLTGPSGLSKVRVTMPVASVS